MDSVSEINYVPCLDTRVATSTFRTYPLLILRLIKESSNCERPKKSLSSPKMWILNERSLAHYIVWSHRCPVLKMRLIILKNRVDQTSKCTIFVQDLES